MADNMQDELRDLLDTWWRARAASLALDEFALTWLDVPSVIHEADEVLFAIRIGAEVRLRELGLPLPG